MIVVGLTGSIAMGKTSVANIFRAKNIPVFDADEIVHELYQDGSVAQKLGPDFAAAITGKIVDRSTLSRILSQQPALIEKLEAIVHPMVQNARNKFLAIAKSQTHQFVVLDIPLLLEKSSIATVDIILVVSCTPELQRARALSRPNMTPEKLEFVLKRQMPDNEKRSLADYLIENNGTLAELEMKVQNVITQIERIDLA